MAPCPVSAAITVPATAQADRAAVPADCDRSPAEVLGERGRFFRRSGQGSSRRCGADNRGREGMPEPCCLLPQMLPQNLTIGSSKIYIIDVILTKASR